MSKKRQGYMDFRVNFIHKYILLDIKICGKYNKVYAHRCQGHARANRKYDL